MLLVFVSVILIAKVHSWAVDRRLENDDQINSCDFARVRVSSGINEGVIDNAEYPMLLNDLMINWPAVSTWTKEYLTDIYGNQSLRTGTESSIVFSGGVAEKLIPLRDVIADLSADASPASDRLFVFDTTITRSNPQWLTDGRVPSIFSTWDNEDNEASGQMWHMLSLGPSLSGLPRHYHGQTWLGVVQGMKRWFVYPPGYNPPPHIEASFNPLLSVSEWVREVYPKLISLPKPPIYHHLQGNNTTDSAAGYRPLECIQRAGEVLYLPKGWSHITINIGETLAFGGQQRSTDNLSESQKLLRTHPNSYDAMRDVGLARTNSATRLKRRLQDLYGTKIVHLRTVQNLLSLLVKTRDTWLVVYCTHSLIADGHCMSEDLMQALERRLRGMVNVALVEEEGVCTTDDCSEAMVVKLHKGLKSSQLNSEIESNSELLVDAEGTLYTGDIGNTTAIEKFVTSVVHSQDLNYGSISTVPSAALMLYAEGIKHLRMSLSIKYHPETYNLLCEIVAETEDQTALSECISRAMNNCDAMVGDKRVSRDALSSLYFRLARIYMTKNLFHAVIPLLQRSLRMNPYNAGALRDQVIVYLNVRDKAMAVHSLHVLESNVVNYITAFEDYQQLKEAVQQM